MEKHGIKKNNNKLLICVDEFVWPFLVDSAGEADDRPGPCHWSEERRLQRWPPDLRLASSCRRRTEGWPLPASLLRLLFGLVVRRFALPVRPWERFWTSLPSLCLCGLKEAVPSGFSSSDVLIPLADEYDPMFPNDYEKVMKRHREERQRQREQERQKEIEEREKYAVIMALD